MSDPFEVKEEKGNCSFTVKVIPRSSVNKVVGITGSALKVKVQAPPVEGAANEAVVLVLAKWLGRPKGAVELMSGDTSRNKRFRVVGVTKAQVLAALEKTKE